MFNALQLPKPISRKAEKAALKRKRQAHIARVRLSEYTPEMHEIQSRAALRGRPVEDIFNLDNCVMLHRKCHRDITEHKAVLP